MTEMSPTSMERPVKLTHGRHCRCTPCARQDWSEPQLAPCGMHGSLCPPVYAPIDAPLGSLVWPNGTVAEPIDREKRVALLSLQATQIADWFERDRREPDKVLCNVQALRRLAREIAEEADHA